MKEFYHGTSLKSAKKIFGPPKSTDVSMGRGELGQGFYLGNEPGVAAALARTRHKKTPAVLIYKIETAIYLQLHIEIIKTRTDLNRLWEFYRIARVTRTNMFGCDVIEGPLATIDAARQYKFESKLSEQVLNSSKIEIVTLTPGK